MRLRIIRGLENRDMPPERVHDLTSLLGKHLRRQQLFRCPFLRKDFLGSSSIGLITIRGQELVVPRATQFLNRDMLGIVNTCCIEIEAVIPGVDCRGDIEVQQTHSPPACGMRLDSHSRRPDVRHR